MNLSGKGTRRVRLGKEESRRAKVLEMTRTRYEIIPSVYLNERYASNRPLRDKEKSRSRSFRRSSFYSIVSVCTFFSLSDLYPLSPRGFLFHLHALYRFVIRGFVRNRQAQGEFDRPTHVFSLLIGGINSEYPRKSYSIRNSRKWPRDENIHSPR